MKNDPLQKLVVSDDEWLCEQSQRLSKLLRERLDLDYQIKRIKNDIQDSLSKQE